VYVLLIFYVGLLTACRCPWQWLFRVWRRLAGEEGGDLSAELLQLHCRQELRIVLAQLEVALMPYCHLPILLIVPISSTQFTLI
jgi:hypothetical protein